MAIDKTIVERTDEEILAIVCGGMEWNWANADSFKLYDLWEELRANLQGAMLAMIGAGRPDAEEDFAFLRDIARIRNNMKREEDDEKRNK